MRFTRHLVLTALVAAGAGPLSAQEPPVVAVVDLGAFSVSLEDATAIGQGIAAMLTTELDERPEVRVIDRADIEEVLRRQQISVGASGVDDAAAIRIGRLLGARLVVLGNVALDSRRARLDLRLVDVETSEVVRSVKESGDRDELLDLTERIAVAFTRDLEIADRPEPEPELRVPAQATLVFSRGLDYEERGETERAAQMYRRALELFPRHPSARDALERVGGR